MSTVKGVTVTFPHQQEAPQQEQGRRAKRGEQKPPAERAPLKECIPDFIERHQLLGGAVVALLVAGVFGATFWFTVFSGLSSSADFIYSQF